MGLPKKKTTSSSSKSRRSHHALNKGALSTCKKCKSPVRPHHACAKCGTYRGREVIDVLSKKEKGKKKTKKSTKKTDKEKETKKDNKKK
ncbi:50S ribosomal protein L32 [Patescibacteria group bacterium]|nr:50S ribosomal protein L32 [Patescibacteria group bacterium]MBU1952578.1 50S ribosomal protein L32 [Patescibacteria group bacterium]